MKLGDMPRGMVRMVIPLIGRADSGEDLAFVRFTCSACEWTTAFKTLAGVGERINPEHECPVREAREAQVLNDEMGEAKKVYSRIELYPPGYWDRNSGSGSEVM